jgi:hypothetical protein
VKYFIIKELVDEYGNQTRSKLSKEDFLLSSKCIGTKLPASGNRFAFIWHDKTLSEAGVKRLVHLGWRVTDENQNITYDIADILGQCELHFFSEI